MKKDLKISIILICSLVLFFGCASKPKVLSTESSKHLTVQQTSDGVFITAHKDKSENISQIRITDSKNGNGAIVDLSKSDSVEFFWPFADSGETYTINGEITSGKSISSESVTFKTEAVSSCITKYNKDFEKIKPVLIATENKRNVRIYSSQDAVTSILGAAAVENAEVLVDVFSGKRFNATEKDSTYIGSFSKSIQNVSSLKSIFDGYDIISGSQNFNLSPAELNKVLSSKPTYFARFCVSFQLADSSTDVKYTTKYIYSNDTIYTPVSASQLPANSADAK